MSGGPAMKELCAILSDCQSHIVNDGHNIEDNTAPYVAVGGNQGSALGNQLKATGSEPVSAATIKSSGPKPSSS